MSKMSWEVVTNHKCLLGEGPVWDGENKRIFWIDILMGVIHYYQIDTRQHRMLKLGQIIGSIALKKTGGLVAALKGGFASVDIDQGTTWFISQIDSYFPDIRFNDGKCDPAGRFWAGTMSISNAAHTSALYSLEKNYEIKKRMDGVSCSNGLAWSPDQKTFYYIDTPTRDVVAYDYEVSEGKINHRRVAVRIPEGEGYPDGMTIDSEGMLWIALWDGWKVVRYNPYTGKQMSEIRLPVSKVTSCVFGGDHLDDLYVTTAKTGATEKELKMQHLAGSLFVIKNTGHKGIKAVEFGAQE